MDNASSWSGNYSRFSYDESKQYLFMLKEQGLEILDDEFNVLQDMLRTSLRRMMEDVAGNCAIGTAFQIVGTGAINDFTITGGGGTVDTAAHVYVDGWMALLLANTSYANQPVVQAALTTPAANRTDEVYLDLWLAEISALMDSTIKDPTLNKETSRRAQLQWAVKVAEGGVTPADYTDSNGAKHHTFKLATLNRTTSATIDAGMVVDGRKVIPTLLTRVAGLDVANVFTQPQSAPNATQDAHLLPLQQALRRFGGYITTINGVAGGTTIALTLANAGLVIIDCTNGPVTATLPTANALAAVPFEFVRIDASSNAATVLPAGTDTINGATSMSVVGQWSYYALRSNGVVWYEIDGPRNTLNAERLAQHALTGGGNIAWSANSLSWSQRFIVVSVGAGAHFSTNGYFDIVQPVGGTAVNVVGGAAARVFTASGVALNNYEALYYALPIGSGSASVPGNFWVASYSSGFVVPNNWILIAVRNDDAGNASLRLGNGVVLKAGQSWGVGQGQANTNGDAGQTFNVSAATSSSHAVRLDQVGRVAPAIATLQGQLLAVNTTYSVTASFTAPGPGIVYVIGAMNISQVSASTVQCNLYFGGNSQSSDATVLPQTHAASAVVTAGQACTSSLTIVTDATTSPGAAASLHLMMFFVPTAQPLI